MCGSYLSRYGSVVPRVASGLFTVQLQLLLQLSAELLRGTVQDELISGELWTQHTALTTGAATQV